MGKIPFKAKIFGFSLFVFPPIPAEYHVQIPPLSPICFPLSSQSANQASVKCPSPWSGMLIFQDKKIFSWLTRNVYSSVCSWWRDVKRTFRQNGCLNFQLLIRNPNFFEFHLIPPLRLFHLQVLQLPADKHHPTFLNNLEENQEQILPGLLSR